MKLIRKLQNIGNNVLDHKIAIINILFILTVSTVAALWFGGNNLIIADDFLYAPNSFRDFLRACYTWTSFSLGSQNIRSLPAILGAALKGGMEVFGLSLVTSEKVWFFLFFASSGLSMYFLVTALVKDTRKYVAGLVAALFYMFNPYVAISITAFTFNWFFYASIPLTLALYIKGVDEGKGLKYAFLTCIVWSITVTINYTRPSFVLFSWAPILLYLVFHILASRNKKVILASLRFTAILLALWTALNFYWIIPTMSSFGSIVASPLEVYATAGASRISGYALSSAPLSSLMRLLGFWALQSGYQGYPYYYWGPAYVTPLFIFIGFLIPVISFSSLLFRNKNKHVLFFSIIAFLALFLSSGVYFPFSINTWLITHIPLGLDIFPRPFQDGTPYVALAFAFLIGYAISTLYNRLHKSCPKFEKRKFHSVVRFGVIIILLFFIVGIYAFPIWTGELMSPGNPYQGSNRYQIPTYYYDAANWLKTQKDGFSIFQLPYSIAGYATYVWNNTYFGGEDPTPFLFDKPVISGLSGSGIGMFAAESVISNSTDEFAKLLALMNVKYVLFQRDANWIYLEASTISYMSVGTSLDQLEAFLNSQRGLTLEKSFGELDFYRNDYWKPVLIYGTTNNVLVKGNISQLTQILEKDEFNSGDSVFSLSNQLNIEQFSVIPANTIFVNGNDFLDLPLSKLGDYVITIPEQASFFIHNESVVVKANFFASSAQIYELWVAVSPSLHSGEVSASINESLIVSSFRLPINSLCISSWANLGGLHLTEGNNVITLNITDVESVPKKIALIPQQTFNSIHDGLSSTLYSGRVVYELKPQPLVTARYYSGWKGVISTNGQGDPDLLIFSSPSACPYINTFPPPSPADWSAYNSTLIYINTGPSGLMISSILADGTQTSALAWWETGAAWATYSVSIPPNQRAILQIGSKLNVVTLQTNIGPITLPVYNGSSNPPIAKSPSETSTRIFIPKAANYLLAINVTTDYGYGNLSIKIDDQTFSVDVNSQEQGPISTYKYIGPISLAAGYHNISTAGSARADNVTLTTNPPSQIDSMLLYSLKNGENFVDANSLLASNPTDNVSITYEKINPTKYVIHVNASTPFFLVFSESYHKDWITYIDGQPVPNEYHFTANGFANGWYINKTDTFTITLEFWPQNLFYAGAAISITTLILCIIYVSKDKIKIIFQKIARNKISRKD